MLIDFLPDLWLILLFKIIPLTSFESSHTSSHTLYSKRCRVNDRPQSLNRSVDRDLRELQKADGRLDSGRWTADERRSSPCDKGPAGGLQGSLSSGRGETWTFYDMSRIVG